MKAVFIIAGHSTLNPGAESKGMQEIKKNKIIAQNLYSKLKNIDNFKSYLIGIDNISLNDKVNKVESICKGNGYNVNNSILIEIHCNAGGGTGIEILTYDKYKEAIKVSTLLLKETSLISGLRNRGIKPGSEYQIINSTTPLAIIFESGFIDTEKDRDILNNNITTFSDGIYNGLKEYIGFQDTISFEEMYNNEKNRADSLENENKILKMKLDEINLQSVYK